MEGGVTWDGGPGGSMLARGLNLLRGALICCAGPSPSRDAAVFVLRVCKLALIRLLGNDVESKLGQR